MTNLKATATINFAKSKIKFSSLEPHIFRTYKQMSHDKNKRINHKLSKLNGSGFPIKNYGKFMEKFVNKKRLARQRKKYLAHRQKSRARKFASPKAFIQSKNHRNCRCGIITLGDHKFQNKLDEIIQKKAPKLNEIGKSYLRQDLLKNYLKNFNSRHKYIKIIAYSIHGDEQFIHAHAEFMGIPTRSKKGNLQLNFNKSLRLEMRNQKEIQAGKLPSNRVALHRFQQQEDPLILSTANKVFGVTLTRHGASKDNQEQHSLAVSEKAKASSYASVASSSARYLNSLNVDFRASLSKSAAKSIKAKRKEIASSQSQALSQAISTATRSENIKYMTQDINIIAARSDANPSNIASLYDDGSIFDGSVMSGASLANYLDSSALSFEMDIANEEPAINDTMDSQSNKQKDLDSQANSIRSASASVASFHDSVRDTMTDTLSAYGPNEDYHNYDDRTLLSKFKGFISNVTNHLHRFHMVLKKTIHRFLPSLSDKGTTGLANGSLMLNHKTQEDLAFKLEDDNAKAIYSKSAQAINANVMKDHGEYNANDEPIQSGSSKEME